MNSVSKKRIIGGFLAAFSLAWIHTGVLGVPAALAAPQGEVKTAAPLISLNKADAAQLESVKGIGPSLAQRIIAYRTERNGFKALEELKEVKGIGQVKYEKIKEQITL